MEIEKNINEQSETKKNVIRIIKGSIFSIIISLILLLIFAILLCYTNLSENSIKPTILVITGVGILIGSMISAKKIRKNGLINGGMVGAVYIIILYMVSSLTITNFSITINSLTMLIVAIITGMIGGIIGINLK
jgi:putative membrane protein (TIGR04086 family)